MGMMRAFGGIKEDDIERSDTDSLGPGAGMSKVHLRVVLVPVAIIAWLWAGEGRIIHVIMTEG